MTSKTYTDADVTVTPWCYMPPEMHFDSPADLKDAFWKFHLSRIQDELNSPVGMNFLPPANKFEKVRSKSGKYVLIPTSLDPAFLFRGQRGIWSQCLPTLYRKKLTEDEYILERLRTVEFINVLKGYPQVKDFEKENIRVDYLGLAQHYGMKTEVLDLTNSLDVALFFAMLNPSDDGRSYQVPEDDKEHIGYVYVTDTMETGGGGNAPHSLFDGKLSAIGMQPFYRPGSQRGFGLHLKAGETFNALLYSFSYTKEDAELVLKEFMNGDTLWHSDEISETARTINEGKTFSYQALNECLKTYYGGTNKMRREYVNHLKSLGYEFVKEPEWMIGLNQETELKREYLRAGGFNGINEIVQRSMTSDGRTSTCISTQHMTYELLVRLPVSGCAAPEGYDSPYGFMQSKDGGNWGVQKRKFTQENQTLPNPETGKVDKWQGRWQDLEIDLHRDRKIKMELVKVPKSS